ncbi:MAG: glycosyltransferase [Ruminococcus sp.]
MMAAVADGSLQIHAGLSVVKSGEAFYIFHREPHGVSRARNYGFAHSHGEYVWFVDSDDFVEPRRPQTSLYEKACR